MRGNLQSRPINAVMDEAKRLRDAGVKELLIISQDTSAYGIDTKYEAHTWQNKTLRTKFYDLVEALGELDIWIRLHYVYPYPHVADIIPLMAEKKILPYLDIPFQHANARILKLMKRPASAQNNLEQIQKWRAICPDIAIRSTFIVGFPGETEQEFEELLTFLKVAQLDRVGCFKYSPVDGAKANDLPDPVSEEIKEERLKRFMSVQAQIGAEKLKQRIGKTTDVLIDSIENNIAIARSYADAPEIDGLVYIKNPQNVAVGEFKKVKIIAAEEHDLWAKIIN